MEQKKLEVKLNELDFAKTWLAEKTYFIAANIKGKYESCVIIFSPLPQSQGEIFLHKRGGIAAIPSEIDDVYKSKYQINVRFINIIINETRELNNYFVFEMKSGNMYNYYIEFNDFFVNYPEGYTENDVKYVYPRKLYFNKKLINYNEIYINKLTFYKAHDYIPSFL